MEFTPEQARAIQHGQGALLVSAAAGSGKTAVLVERAVRLLCREEDPVPADQLLIVTFTRAAAASLRGKLAQRLAGELAKKPGSAHLRRQRMLLQRAPICTIDAYCLQLVQAHFSRLDIPPDFSTADGPQLAALRAQSLADALETAYTDPDFCAFADLYGKGRSDWQAARVLEALHDFLSSMPDPARTLEDFCAAWEQAGPLDDTAWGKALRAEGRRGAECALALAQQNLREAEADGGLAPYLPALRADLAAAEHLLSQISTAPWDEILAAFRALCYERLGAVRGYEGCHMEPVKARRELLKKTLARLQENVFVCSTAEFEADRAAAAPLVRALARAERDFQDRFFAAKQEEKTLEFSDVEHLALRLLQTPEGEPTELARQVSGGFFAVMVDEYQDTNALQDALYACLARAGGEDLFFVGDLKQSIYRFRQADPSIFQAKLERFAPYGQGGAQKLFLDANVRSAPGVIAGVNAVFGPLMSRALGGVEYGPGERLAPGFGGAEGYGGYMGGCEVRLVESTRPEAEAEYAARRIAELTDPAGGFAVRDGAGGTRPARYEDFCILLRSRGSFEVFADALEARGIPAYVDRAENLLDAPEVRPVASLLRVLDNPAQDVHLAAVMLGLSGFEPDDLVRLRAERPKGSFYGAVMAAEDEKTLAFAERLRGLRQLAQTVSVDRLMEEIFIRTGCLAAAGAMPEGPARRENLRQFAQFAAGCGKNGLAGVVRAMDAALATGGVPGPEQGQSRPGCVTVMTVHRSKGLEFPVVLACGLAKTFNKEDLRAAAVFHPALGIGLTLRAGQGGTYPTAPYRAVQAAIGAEGLSEEMRVLYVALTRAKDRLILTAAAKDPARLLERLAAQLPEEGRPREYLLQRCQSPAEWVLLAALPHPAAGALRAAVAAPVRPAPGDAPGWLEVTVEGDSPAAQRAEARTGLPEAPPDRVLAQQVEERLAWTYPRAALAGVPAKVSVTALVHSAEEATLQRPSFLYKEGLTAAEKGTALHAFLQYADFEAASADVRAEARRQVEKRLLLPELYDKMDFEKLEEFFQSPAYARIKAADRVLREYDFITSIPAEQAAPEAEGELLGARTLVQGVADLVLEFSDHLEILDYKTDRGKTHEQFVAAYRPQLLMYAEAIDRRFKKPVTRLSLYSFDLGVEIAVDLA